jgi:GrpB-like predicted nucleotidyltransferase (UPF0157 family)
LLNTHNSTIGLKSGIVRIVKHRTAWAVLYNTEAEILNNCLGDIAVDIQHVGSTLVPGLIAKPIIDTAIAVNSREAIFNAVNQLLYIGYIDKGDQGATGGYLIARDSELGVRTFHIHIVEKTDIQWRNYITFRDCLRRDAKTRAEYARLKKDLAAKFPRDRRSYTNRKEQFIRNVLAKLTSAE